MGTMSFLLPPDLPAEATRELLLACLAGGLDNAPNPTQVQVQGNRLTLSRAVDESGFLITPWRIDGAGRLMTTTTTLMERAEPYSLLVELARGKMNQIRNYVAECQALGFRQTPALVDGLAQLNRRFGEVLALHPSRQADESAQQALSEAFRLIDELLPHCAEEMFRVRHERLPRLNTVLGPEVSAAPPADPTLAASFNGIRLALGWRSIEPTESQYDWSAADAVLDWAEANGLAVTGGPLIDFSAASVPDWLWIWQGDLSNLANFMCDYVETVITRYRKHIPRWFIATGCNVSGVLGLGEDDILWLTARLAEAALQIAPESEIILGVSQPWADYMAREEHTYTPLVFLDTLLRTGLKLAALDVELVMGVGTQGSYCRDLLELSRLLDSYAVLSTPVQVTLGVPSAAGEDSLADPNLSVGLGEWQHGFNHATQAHRGGRMAAVALSKPFVTGVYWTHLSDALPHRFPHCGLLDANNQPKPIVAAIRNLRQAHL